MKVEERIEVLFEKRKAGMEYSQMRDYLEDEGLDAWSVNQIIRGVNELELQSLQKPSRVQETRIALIVGAVMVLIGIVMWLWIRAREIATGWQFLAALPVLGAIGLYLISKSNANKRNRVGVHTRFQ